MQKMKTHYSKKAGFAPGTAMFVGEQKAEQVKITVIDYDKDRIDSKVVKNVEECFAYKETPTCTWINVDGMHDADVIERLGQHYGLHPLVIEDVLHTRQRQKIDIFDEHLFVVLKMFWFDEASEEVNVEQVSMILGRNFVLTFQEREGDVFEAVRTRLFSNKGRVRKSGADYLTYALMDAIIDGYFAILDYFGEQFEQLDDAIAEGPTPEVLHAIHALKREVIFFRKTVSPLRTMMNELIQQESPLIEHSTNLYWRDLSDHVMQVIESSETFRDMVSDLHDIYLSSMSNKMNEIMQFLTIVGTIFIPLTFIAGIYGMNFQVMPELSWRWGYFAVLGLMAAVGGGLLVYFRKRGWL